MPRTVLGVATRGSPDNSEWVRQYKVMYTYDGYAWKDVDQGRVFDANTDNQVLVRNDFVNPVTAIAVRICPLAWNNHISMKAEVYIELPVIGMDAGKDLEAVQPQK